MAFEHKGEFQVEFGFGLPRKTTAERLAYTPPQTGYQVFDTDLAATFVYNGTAWDQLAKGADADSKVNKAGDTMTGALVLPADPVNPLEATTKQYVDAAITVSENNAVDSIDDLSDVVITTPLDGNALFYDGTNFVNRDIVLTDVSDFDATDYATAAQGALADTAVQKAGDTMSGDLSIVIPNADVTFSLDGGGGPSSQAIHFKQDGALHSQLQTTSSSLSIGKVGGATVSIENANITVNRDIIGVSIGENSTDKTLVPKEYVDAQIISAGGDKVDRTGDTMTGDLTLTDSNLIITDNGGITLAGGDIDVGTGGISLSNTNGGRTGISIQGGTNDANSDVDGDFGITVFASSGDNNGNKVRISDDIFSVDFSNSQPQHHEAKVEFVKTPVTILESILDMEGSRITMAPSFDNAITIRTNPIIGETDFEAGEDKQNKGMISWTDGTDIRSAAIFYDSLNTNLSEGTPTERVILEKYNGAFLALGGGFSATGTPLTTQIDTNAPIVSTAPDIVANDDDGTLTTKKYVDQLAATSGASELDELDDVTITTPDSGHGLFYDGTNFVNRVAVKSDISDFSDGDYATAAQGVLADGALQRSGGTVTGDVVFQGNGGGGTKLDLQSAPLEINSGTFDAIDTSVRFTRSTLNIDSSDDSGIVFELEHYENEFAETATYSKGDIRWGTGTTDGEAAVYYDSFDVNEGVGTERLLLEKTGGAFLALGGGTSNANGALTTQIDTNSPIISTAATIASDVAGTLTTKGYVDQLAASSASELDELNDVTITTPASGHGLFFDGTNFVNRVAVKADISDFTEADYVHTTGDETIAGAKTFSGAVDFDSTVLLAVDPTDALQAATKQYVDSAVATGVGGISTDDLLDVDTSTTAPVTGHGLFFDGTNFVNRVAVKADISDFSDADYAAAVHVHTKSDITDFTESDYVHTTGDEIIGGNKTFSDDVTVSGDLIVQGTTTSVNSTNTEITDSIITLNKGETGAGATAPTQSGIRVDRGTEVDSFIIWDESVDKFGVGLASGIEDTDNVGAIDPFVTESQLNATSHTESFVAGDWTTGTPNTYTITQATHGIEVDDTYHVSVFENGQRVGVEYSINASGDVTLSTAGATFAGKVRISL